MFNQFQIEERIYNGQSVYIPYRTIFGVKVAITFKNGKISSSILDTGRIYRYIVDAYGIIQDYCEQRNLQPVITHTKEYI